MTKRKLNTKQKILTTAGRLFSVKGYFGVSMQDIADELDITKAALYYHYESKEELTQILLKKTTNALKIELKQACESRILPSDKIFGLIKTFLDFKIEHPELSLLVSLGVSSDERMPIIQFVVTLRRELTKFFRDLIGGIDFTRKLSYKSLFILSTSVIGFVLGPFKHKNTKQLTNDFIELMLLQESLNISKKNPV